LRRPNPPRPASTRSSPPPTVASVLIHANPAVTRPVSPWIYGANFYQSFESLIRNLTFNRHGGNRWTACNWENNSSNAGNDYNFQNDSYLSESSIAFTRRPPALTSATSSKPAPIWSTGIL